MANPGRSKIATAFECFGAFLLMASYGVLAILFIQAVPIIASASLPVALVMCFVVIPACVFVVVQAAWDVLISRIRSDR